jgi:hypothetical protein
MFTSNFKLSGNNPNAVAISRGVPKGWTGRRYYPLAPKTWALVKETREDIFREQFGRQLTNLDAHAVMEELGPDAILLCWEAPGEFCHRRLVAKWLERETGIAVPELGTR